jgi:hypothetical protein
MQFSSVGDWQSKLSPNLCDHTSSDMSLTIRPTGLGAGIDKDRPDYTVYCGG